MAKEFLSGNDAFAEGVRLACPQVIAAYPITPQTAVVERLSEMVENGNLKSEFIHVESEHSALSAAIGASSIGARAFTATSSQGLLYMAECLRYASGGRFPIVMMNANRSTALPWNIFGDQTDSISQLNSGWLQVYVENAQESLDMAIQSFRIAEDKNVLTPVMVNLDGFVITHTYELVDIPEAEQVDNFLPKFETPNKMDLDNPKSLALIVGPSDNFEFNYLQHKAIMDSKKVIQSVDEEFYKDFGRKYGGLIDSYYCDDAEYILITLGSITGIAREVVDELRNQGEKVGALKIRFLRPFPDDEILEAISNAKSIGVLEKDISFGYEGTVYTNVNSALVKGRRHISSYNFIAGLGGRDITKDNIIEMFSHIKHGGERVKFVCLGVNIDE